MPSRIISASILSADFGHLADQVKEAESAGVDWIHIDVMDGDFVENITMGPVVVEACRRITSLPLDVHLMINQPARHLSQFARAGANGISIQVEACPNIHRDLMAIKSLGCKAGVVLNPGTSLSALDSLLGLADLILLMSVNPGASGQEFIPETITRISLLRKKLNDIGSNALIQVDGGIKPENIHEISEAGADIFVAASAIFKTPEGIPAAVKSLKSALK